MVLAAVALPGCGGGGTGVPPGVPSGPQLRELLPKTQALPAGWRVTYAPAPARYVQAGSKPPVPLTACYDFNTGFDLGVAGDTFLSVASETAYNGPGMLRIDLFGVLPADAAKAINAVKAWVGRCSSYTSGPIAYSVTAAPVPGLGDQSLDVHVTPTATGGVTAPVFGRNTLVVRVGNDLIAIECAAPSGLLLSSLSGIAGPVARRLPSASSLAVSAAPAPASPRAASPAPVPSPNLTAGQLQALLPVRSGLPSAFYQTTPQYESGNDAPPYSRPGSLPCRDLPDFGDQGFIEFDPNVTTEADEQASDDNSDEIHVWLVESASAALTSADFSSLREFAARCPSLEFLHETYRTTRTPVPGVGNESFYVRMRPVSGIAAGGLGEQDILLARVGNDALVMVACDMSAGDPAPPLVPIARSLARSL